MDKERTKINLQNGYSYPAGDFRSPECIELLKEADIVVTNPPFSLLREYVMQLLEYDKKFLIIGNKCSIGDKTIFPLFRDNKIWLGVSVRRNASMGIKNSNNTKFYVSDKYESNKSGFCKFDKEGKKYVNMSNIRWFTNLKTGYRQKPLDMQGVYYTPEKYPKYDNYDAINVDKVADIPCDYPGVMGVPLSFMDKYCPEQFEIEGITGRGNNVAFKTKIYTKEDAENYGDHNAHPVLLKDGKLKSLYTRIFIKNQHPENSEQNAGLKPA